MDQLDSDKLTIGVEMTQTHLQDRTWASMFDLLRLNKQCRMLRQYSDEKYDS